MGECPECNKRTLLSSERMDTCSSCGWYAYYPDAYIEGDSYCEGFDDDYINR